MTLDDQQEMRRPDPLARLFALLGEGLSRVGLRRSAAAVFAAAGDRGGRDAAGYLKRALRLHFEAGDLEKAGAVSGTLGYAAEADPDTAFIMFSLASEEVGQRALCALQRTLLGSRNLQYIRLALSIPLMDGDSDADYALLQETARFLEGQTGARGVHAFLCADLVMWALMRCDFPAARRYIDIAQAQLDSGRYGIVGRIVGFHLLHWSGDEKAAGYALGNVISPSPPGARAQRMAMPRRADDGKIRIGYVSADFFPRHATMKLLGNVLERHDSERFEITLFCLSPDDEIRQVGLEREKWGKVIDVKPMTDEEIAACVRENGIDILVDLKGYTLNHRCRIFNLPSAPVHVAWLGYPAPALNVDLDYVIGDRFVLPDSARPDWQETFCRLPETYQPNDPVNRPPIMPATRADFGLPADRFIYASCNNPHKITPRVIDLWCGILRRAPESILWLHCREETHWRNLLREFARQGIAEERIFHMPFEGDYARHLNRMQLADLGLDTFPCNGHTTTSEQLWAGLPVLAVKGTHFASRVSESLLNAIGLAELVAEDDAAYVAQAVALYEDRALLARHRHTLELGRFTRPLFDAERFCRHLETAYEMMAARAQAGLEPAVIDVPALPPREGSFEARAVSAAF